MNIICRYSVIFAVPLKFIFWIGGQPTIIRTPRWYRITLCTMQVAVAQCRLMVHNIVLYHCSGAQHRSHKHPPHTDEIDYITLTSDAGSKNEP